MESIMLLKFYIGTINGWHAGELSYICDFKEKPQDRGPHPFTHVYMYAENSPLL